LPHPWHAEVPRPGIEPVPHSSNNARSLTHYATRELHWFLKDQLGQE